MRATINVEFTDDELRGYAEDVGRRVCQNFIRDAIKSFRGFKVPPGYLESLVSAFASGSHPGPTATAESGLPKAPNSPRDLNRCVRCDSEGDPHRDDGWHCCKCTCFNGNQRPICRNCNHERCDVIVTPPPAEDSPQA